MLNWIESWFRASAGAISRAALNAIHVALHAIGGVIHTVFGDVNAAWSLIQTGFWDVFGEIQYLSQLADHGFWWLLKKGIPGIFNWTAGELNKLSHALAVLYNWAVSEIRKAINLAERYALDLWNWAYQNIVKPIDDSLTSAWKWISSRGEYVWYLTTHPDKLMDLLLNYLAGAIGRASNTVIEDVGSVVLMIVVKQVPRFAHIIETIIVDTFM